MRAKDKCDGKKENKTKFMIHLQKNDTFLSFVYNFLAYEQVSYIG